MSLITSDINRTSLSVDVFYIAIAFDYTVGPVHIVRSLLLLLHHHHHIEIYYMQNIGALQESLTVGSNQQTLKARLKR